METNKWRIEELTTEGWTLLEGNATNLSKDQCDALLNRFVQEGYNPNSMRAVPDVGTPYESPKE